MINFTFLEENKENLRLEYLTNKPFSHLVLDAFCDEHKLLELRRQIPELNNKSRDYMFANNKFEKSNYKELGSLFLELYNDLKSKRFNDFLSYISGKTVFVDPRNHGGGLHQGKQNSSLDMHLDFNYHPLKHNWFRQMNILLYLNIDWKESYKGHLKLEDLRTGEKDEIGVPFNRVIIQECGSHSLHGYDQTFFPEGNFRTSIATYAYTVHNKILEKPRTTDWFPTEDASSFKKFAAKHYNKAVTIKNKLFGSGTAKNQ
ncbi:2OG-Fe(II) oxygenase [Polaribacter sp. MED152]|uniref:2OG-Fe(II) oxygenase n=1 Tax=Polaribacter sp. MED152 TaxID=313598 RepID=UPI000068CD1A|nr:2OG-Fe(II) oxygenase [Polaribacter sp. MED152]EAQ43172.1 hypothetical protein MED152_10620 [Polaribacter sp. MED152]